MNKYKTLMQNLKEIIYLYLLSVMKNNKSKEYKIYKTNIVHHAIRQYN